MMKTMLLGLLALIACANVVLGAPARLAESAAPSAAPFAAPAPALDLKGVDEIDADAKVAYDVMSTSPLYDGGDDDDGLFAPQVGNNPDPINCTDPRTSCNARGVCHPDGMHCICDNGYTTIPKNSDTQCNYKQKSQFNAFYLLPWETLFGFTYFYLNHTGMGISKVCLVWVGVLLNAIGKAIEVDCLSFLGGVMEIIAAVWTIVLAFQVYSGTVQDGDGVSLANM